jgi:hypothetical protein
MRLERFRRPIRAFTLATSSFRTVADLDAQVRRAVVLPWRYATVDLGVGDLCAGTSLATFRAKLKRALTVLGQPAQLEVDGLDPQVGRVVLVLVSRTLPLVVIRADPAAARALETRGLAAGSATSPCGRSHHEAGYGT